MATVTALRVRDGRVAVELDGVPWRTVSVVAAAEAGLAVGLELDRVRARTLARALRRRRAQDVVVRALARRDHSRAALEARLVRAGVAPEERRDVLGQAERAGLVDDVRFAERRARDVAERGAGDLLVLDDLFRHGVDERIAREALSTLVPERERAERIVEARGAVPRTLRYLASRGFSEEVLEALIAKVESGALR